MHHLPYSPTACPFAHVRIFPQLSKAALSALPTPDMVFIDTIRYDPQELQVHAGTAGVLSGTVRY